MTITIINFGDRVGEKSTVLEIKEVKDFKTLDHGKIWVSYPNGSGEFDWDIIRIFKENRP